MNKPKILFFDIETSPCMMWGWSGGKQYVTGEQILEDSRIICISYKWQDEDKIYNIAWDSNKCDKRMLERFSKIMDQADMSLGHNGKNFDARHIHTRLALHRLPPVKFALIEDTLLKARPAFRLPSYKLSYLAQYFGVGSKLETGGIQLWLDIWLKNDRKALKRMISYCNQDVALLEAVYNEIKPYIPNTFNLSAYYEDPTICPSCAGPLVKNGSGMSSMLRKVQRYKCTICGKRCQSGRNLLKNTADYPR